MIFSQVRLYFSLQVFMSTRDLVTCQALCLPVSCPLVIVSPRLTMGLFRMLSKTRCPHFCPEATAAHTKWPQVAVGRSGKEVGSGV